MRKRKRGCAVTPIVFGVFTMLAAVPASARDTDACSSRGCFEASVAGIADARLAGRAWFKTLPDGGLRIILAADSKPAITLILARDVAGPAGEQRFSIAPRSCDEEADEDPAAGDSRQRPEDDFHVAVRGGPPWAPSWLGVANSGQLTLTPAKDGTIAGRLAVSVCGEDLQNETPIGGTVAGTFRAVRAP